MLKLASTQREPYWIDLLPGVRVKVRPINVAAIIAARQAAAEAMKDSAEDAVFVGSAAFTRKDELANYRLLVATNFVSVAYLKEVEARIMAYLDKIEKKIDRVIEQRHPPAE